MPEIEVSPILLVPGLSMILLALVFVLGWKITERPPWSFFLWGALALIISFIIRTIIEVFGTVPLFQALTGLPETPANLLYLLYLAMLVSVFDTGLMLLFVRVSGVGRANWQQAVAYGIGFGAIWSLILGISGAFTALRAIVSPELTPVDQLLQMQSLADNFWLAFPPQFVERIGAIVGNITAAALIIYAYRSGAWRYFWAALVYATLVEGMPVWVIQALRGADVTAL
ncbi:MAG: YhfC family intramembrane metalloprotease, partial [Chloroflexi bacterium]|nr:YhfC family intramembrane metalloprotease [Chloroflexota bacterium]